MMMFRDGRLPHNGGMTHTRSFQQSPDNHIESGADPASRQPIRRVLAAVRKAHDDAIYLNRRYFRGQL